jgi:ABC-2 type transport system ATP-binding protein
VQSPQEELRRVSVRPQEDDAIVADQLTKVYPGKRAIENVSFRVQKGEIVGFLGPNGAGKSTTMRILTGFQPATAGTARVAGFDVFEQADEVKRNIGYLPEAPPIYTEMRVREYLEFVARIKGVGKKLRRARIDEAIEKCGLEEVAHRITGKLSKGYRQRVGIAQAVLHKPPILILDEPTSGLDPKQVVEVRRLILGLAKSMHQTILLSTHILPEVSMTCGRVIIINHGHIVLSQSLEDLSGENQQNETIVLELIADGDVAPPLQGLDGVRSVEASSNGAKHSIRVICERSDAMRARLSGFIAQQGWQLLLMRPQETSLEEVYLKVIAAEGRHE